MELTQEDALRLAKERGLVPQDYQIPKAELSKEDAIKLGLERGLIKPREDGAGFMTRTKFGLTRDNKEKQQILDDEYGKGKAIKIDDRWLVYQGKDKGWNAIDDNKLSWVDMIEPSLQTAGAVVGGIFGTPASGIGAVPGAVAGGAIGTGVARSTKDLLRDYFNINLKEDKRDFTEKLVDKSLGVVKDASYGGIAELGGIGVGKLADKYAKPIVDFFAKPFASSMRPDAQEIIRLAKENGIEVMPTMINDSKSLATLENLLAKGFGGDRITNIRNSQNEKIDLNTMGLLNSLTKGKNSQQIGNDVLDAIKTNRAEKDDLLGQRYQDLASKINSPIEMNNLRSTADEIINKPSMGVYESTALKDANKFIDFLGNNNNKADYEAFKTERTGLIKDILSDKIATNGNKTADQVALKKAMDKDFNDYAITNGLGDEKKVLDSDFASFKDAFDNKNKIVGDILLDDAKGSFKPASIPKDITKDITNAENITNALNGDKELLSQSFGKVLEQVSRKTNGDNPIPLKGTVSMDKLNTHLINNKDTFEYALNPTMQKEFSDKILLSKAVNSATIKNGNPSGTAQNIAEIPAVLSAVGGALSAGDSFITGGLAGAGAYGATRLAVPKLYTSELGKKYLTEGFDVGNGAVSQTLMGQPARRVGFYEALKGLEPSEKNK